MSEHSKREDLSTKPSEVKVITTPTGTDQYRIVATATFKSTPTKIWELLWDWEQLLAVGLPGITNNFQWLSGGPDEIPSTFQFEIGGIVIKEEIYERISKESHCLRYRTLEPALGVLDYEAILELRPIGEKLTAFSATREITFEPGVEPNMLAEIVQSETSHLQQYFAD